MKVQIQSNEEVTSLKTNRQFLDSAFKPGSVHEFTEAMAAILSDHLMSYMNTESPLRKIIRSLEQDRLMAAVKETTDQF
jgi:hypothetical protein